ncbi:MAG: hypothetical protein A2114_01175 [Candidatus Vogelbacteria bacterium GWA1_51_14]|uniref:Uncharacterized protein n=1 Tax=Candidatus Vogelbacteria bacterium GWA1_51_14 TaxID=1802435 RepID=A0A1G2Q9N6_9BACT|nr:MAG: hypothetical protein A2114_01175 [Candidatus Vogelbacteria bacterium GWA1_51_14]
MSKVRLVTEAQGLWVAKEGRRLGVKSTEFDQHRGEISKFLSGLGSIIKINRRQPLTYPDFVDKPLHPDMENKGPGPIDLDPQAKQVEQWLHPDQENSWVKGQVIYDHQVASNELELCFGLRELLAIQARGLDFFRRYFQNKTVFGWKGVVLARGGRHVPCLFERGGGVCLRWSWLGYDWYASSPALRLAR